MNQAHHINYADRRWLSHQHANHEGALATGAFATSRMYRLENLSEAFRKNNAALLANDKGAGYWVWKPQIILQSLQEISEGDILMYTDSGTTWVGDPRPLFDLFHRGQDVVGFYLVGTSDAQFSKRDTVMACMMENKIESPQIMGGVILFRASPESRHFVREWKRLCRIPRLVDDSPSVMPPYGGFKEHRHDQSIFSLLYKREGYNPTFPAPTEWGDDHDERRRALGYTKVLSHPGFVHP